MDSLFKVVGASFLLVSADVFDHIPLDESEVVGDDELNGLDFEVFVVLATNLDVEVARHHVITPLRR